MSFLTTRNLFFYARSNPDPVGPAAVTVMNDRSSPQKEKKYSKKDGDEWAMGAYSCTRSPMRRRCMPLEDGDRRSQPKQPGVCAVARDESVVHHVSATRGAHSLVARAPCNLDRMCTVGEQHDTECRLDKDGARRAARRLHRTPDEHPLPPLAHHVSRDVYDVNQNPL